MSFGISLLREEDIPDLVDVDDIAMRNYSWAQAMSYDLPKDVPRKQLIEQYMRQGFQQDESNVWLKATDASSGQLIASALWQFDFEGSRDIPHSDTGTDRDESNEPPKTFQALASKRHETFKHNFIGSKPNAYLAILFTHPDHRRRGIGSRLIEWGCQKADKKGVVTYLHASPEGLTLYLKHDFEVVFEDTVDLTPWGVNEVVTKASLTRLPRRV